MGNQKDNAFFGRVLEQVRNIPISEIIYDLYQQPKKLCPFHDDKHAGSFTVSERYNNYKCWSCQASGNGITYVENIEHIGFKEAVFKLALSFNIVQLSDIKKYYNNEMIGMEDVRTFEKKNYVEDELFPRASDEKIDKVYRSFIKVAASLHEEKLLPAHLEHLKSRGFSKKEIEKIGFFSMPKRSKNFIKHLLDELKDVENPLLGVPGFYKMEEKNTYTYMFKHGIGIPIMNEHHQIVGIQIRKDKAKKGEQRYIWFSSGFVNEQEGLTEGTSSKSPLHFVYPYHKESSKILFITEGAFKAEYIAKTYDAYAISVQGIGNWNQTLIDLVRKFQENGVHSVFIAFDSDIAENINVYQAFHSLGEQLLNDLPQLRYYYSWWRMECGKGIDDVIQNKRKQFIHKIPMEQFIREYDNMLQEIMDFYGEDSIQHALDAFIAEQIETQNALKENGLENEIEVDMENIENQKVAKKSLIKQHYHERVAPLFIQ